MGTVIKDHNSTIIKDKDTENNNIILINQAQWWIYPKNLRPRVLLSPIDRNNLYSMISIQENVIEQTTIRAATYRQTSKKIF